MKVAYQDTSH
uniref:Uncharacterized protein n=1 Tax=Arundo donax TaxID=35708 RepID=A0A0A9B1L4_ARUDO